MYKYTLPNGIPINIEPLTDAVLVESDFPQTYLDTKTGLTVEVPSPESLAEWVQEIGKTDRYLNIERFSDSDRNGFAKSFITEILKQDLSASKLTAVKKVLKDKGWRDFEVFLMEKTDGWMEGWVQYINDVAWESVQDWIKNNPKVNITTDLDMPEDCKCAICATMKSGTAGDPEILRKAFETEEVMRSVQNQLSKREVLKDKVVSRDPKMADKAFVFKVFLSGTDPEVWRQIAVPADYTFFELHCAIEDAMGWKGYHLHMFRIIADGADKDAAYGKGVTTVALPNPDFALPEPGDFEDKDEHAELLSDWFNQKTKQCFYDYDFGDGWVHSVKLEKVIDREGETVYPLCIDGKNACPPEDCGGFPGFDNLKKVLADKKHPDHKYMLEWLGLKKATDFDFTAFDSKTVVFSDPKLRLKELGL